MFNKVMVANRGAAASRVLRALRALGIRSVAVFSEADRDLAYVAEADEAHLIGPSPPAQSYLNQDRIVALARQCNADALHPGYGFLSENAGFARAVEDAGVTFIGPQPRWLEAMGHKSNARMHMAAYGLSMTASSGILPDELGEALIIADRIGFPVMIKPVAGGGGIGMIAARNAGEFAAHLPQARSLAQRSFGDGALFLERLIERPRHVEFQILADRFGNARHLFERDCSVQRRNQKVIEEAPAPGLPTAKTNAMAERLAAIVGRMGYANIGTVETLYDGQEFHFLEMNTRLQVEHAVTEEVTGVDIVLAQIALAAGAKIDEVLPRSIVRTGHALEARIYAEDPIRFLPSPGVLDVFRPPVLAGVRVETGYREGNAVTPYYDPMIAKVIAKAPTRPEAIRLLSSALTAFEIEGVRTNIAFVLAVLEDEAFRRGDVDTALGSAVQQRRR